jgi:hypothetical protein
MFIYEVNNISLWNLHNLNKLGWTQCEIGRIEYLVAIDKQVLNVTIIQKHTLTYKISRLIVSVWLITLLYVESV